MTKQQGAMPEIKRMSQVDEVTNIVKNYVDLDTDRLDAFIGAMKMCGYNLTRADHTAPQIEGLDAAINRAEVGMCKDGDKLLLMQAAREYQRVCADLERAWKHIDEYASQTAAPQEVVLTPELCQVCICAWNNVPVDNAAMKKYTDESFGKASMDGWRRVAVAVQEYLRRNLIGKQG